MTGLIILVSLVLHNCVFFLRGNLNHHCVRGGKQGIYGHFWRMKKKFLLLFLFLYCCISWHCCRLNKQKSSLEGLELELPVNLWNNKLFNFSHKLDILYSPHNSPGVLEYSNSPGSQK